jgi:enoyl-CoA hydratase
MAYETLLYEVKDRIATITLNRPEKYNTIKPPMPQELEHALTEANRDSKVHVVILQANGKAFCAGFDFGDDLEHFKDWGAPTGTEQWDPGKDLLAVSNPFTGPVPKLMSVWKSPKPVVARVHGWAVGGGSELALMADVIIASEDAQIGTPYSRVWGCALTGLWAYRLGLTRAKLHALTGDPLSGRAAADLGLINIAVPGDKLAAETRRIAERMANIPISQLVAMKMIVNQAYENMGLQTTQQMGWILDGYMRNTPEGRDFVKVSLEQGVGAAVSKRDGPFGDYSASPQGKKPFSVP